MSGGWVLDYQCGEAREPVRAILTYQRHPSLLPYVGKERSGRITYRIVVNERTIEGPIGRKALNDLRRRRG